jgi:transposase-like protein
MEIDKNALQQMIKTNDIKTTEDLQVLLGDLTREMIDTIYGGELTAHLGYERHAQGSEKNCHCRNGHGKMKVISIYGKALTNSFVSPTKDTLLKLVFLAMWDIERKWTMAPD